MFGKYSDESTRVRQYPLSNPALNVGSEFPESPNTNDVFIYYREEE